MSDQIKRVDKEGEETLRAIAEADQFNAWMYEEVRPFAKGSILEIGSGIGNLSAFFVRDGYDITLSDVRAQYTEQLSRSFPGRRVLEMDLVHPDFSERYREHLGNYDLVFALNVVEHIRDDRLALSNMRSLLRPGGVMFVLVPAYPFLFNHFDKALEHFRRYTRRSLSEVHPSGLAVIRTRYFNLMGIPGWFLVGGVLRKKTIPVSNMRMYNFLTLFSGGWTDWCFIGSDSVLYKFPGDQVDSCA
jgi:SAM-dependent methyltransferase